jgi:hypothetical protein
MELTQKARGVVALRDTYDISVPAFNIVTDPVPLSQREEPLPYRNSFVRPCPSVPRHGWLESRPLKTWGEVSDLLGQARCLDPKAQILIMPQIAAKWSGVITRDLVALGAGHDGVTNGRDGFSVPMLPIQLRQGLLTAAGVKTYPYIEIVYGVEPMFGPAAQVYAVQLRDGPIVPQAQDYIPEATKVTEVVEPAGDLVEWMDRTAKFTKGTVVYAPHGVLCSHWAVHCLLQKIPYITTFEPTVGDTLSPTDSSMFAEDYSVESCIEGLTLGLSDTIFGKDRRATLQGAFTILHNAPVLRAKATRLIGAAASIMLRFGVAACMGEHRHLPPSLGGSQTAQGTSREAVYTKAFCDHGSGVAQLQKMRDDFWTKSWQNASVGGWAWGNCLEATLDIAHHIQRIVVEKDAKQIKSLISAMNVFVNAAHNNGWWLNKFIQEDQFIAASHNALPSVVAALPLFWRVMRRPRLLKRGLTRITGWKLPPNDSPYPIGMFHNPVVGVTFSDQYVFNFVFYAKLGTKTHFSTFNAQAITRLPVDHIQKQLTEAVGCLKATRGDPMILPPDLGPFTKPMTTSFINPTYPDKVVLPGNVELRNSKPGMEVWYNATRLGYVMSLPPAVTTLNPDGANLGVLEAALTRLIVVKATGSCPSCDSTGHAVSVGEVRGCTTCLHDAAKLGQFIFGPHLATCAICQRDTLWTYGGAIDHICPVCMKKQAHYMTCPKCGQEALSLVRPPGASLRCYKCWAKLSTMTGRGSIILLQLTNPAKLGRYISIKGYLPYSVVTVHYNLASSATAELRDRILEPLNVKEEHRVQIMEALGR